ncbi:MAG: AAA family ATPase [Chloroflexi bacterium]|nr:AAA family ATPase [Chloroflexota bacterium]
MSQPLLLVVTGAPCSGKTTLATRIAENVGLTPITKDAIKKSLFDTMDWNARERGRGRSDTQA